MTTHLTPEQERRIEAVMIIPCLSAAILCVAASTLHAQPAGEDLLAQVRAKVLANVGRLSNYVCTETVDRKVYELRDGGISPKACAAFLDADRGGHLCYSDRLRLDVGIAKTGEEMYSWPGEDRFEANSPHQLVQGAAMRGTFAGFLNAIFRQDPATMSYRGELRSGERDLAEYDLRASREQSHLHYEEDFSIVTAYEGSFVVDSRALDLLQLTVRHLNLPQSAYACAVATTMDYHKVEVNGATLVLPAAAQVVFIDKNGTRAVNQTTFSDCHQFVGQSELYFGNQPGKGGPSHPMPAEIGVTKDLPFEVTIGQDVDTRTAAAGDPLRCELATPIRDGERVVAPAGTPVTARILQLTRISHSPCEKCELLRPSPGSVTFSFRLEKVLIGGKAQTLSAHPQSTSAEPDPKPGKVTWSSAGDRLTGTLGPKGSLIMTNGLRTQWVTGK